MVTKPPCGKCPDLEWGKLHKMECRAVCDKWERWEKVDRFAFYDLRRKKVDLGTASPSLKRELSEIVRKKKGGRK